METEQTTETRLSRLENLFERQYVRTVVRLDEVQAKRLLNLKHSYFAERDSWPKPYDRNAA